MGRFEVLRVFRQGRISGWGLDPGGGAGLEGVMDLGTQYPIPFSLRHRGYTVYTWCAVCSLILLEYPGYHPLVHGVECVDASGVVRSVPAGLDPMGGWSDGCLDTWYLVLWSWGYSPSSPLPCIQGIYIL